MQAKIFADGNDEHSRCQKGERINDEPPLGAAQIYQKSAQGTAHDKGDHARCGHERIGHQQLLLVYQIRDDGHLGRDIKTAAAKN